MANNGIVNSLTFTGSVVGSATIQAQSVAGNLTFLLPNQVPTALQILTAQTINGNVVSLGWSAPQSAPSFSTITGSLALSQIAQSGASTNDVIQWNGTAWAASASAPGSGTVTSVALSAPGSVFSVGGTPITGAGTLALTFATQSPNQVWAGPVSGGAATPTFRALVAADIGTGIVSIAAINSKRGTGGFVQLAVSGTAGVAGDVVTFDVNGNTVDSGTLLSSLATTASLSAYALLAGAAFTGAVTMTTAGTTLSVASSGGDALHVTSGQSQFDGILWVNGQLLDGASSHGTAGQVLNSTVSGVAWTTNPVTTDTNHVAARIKPSTTIGTFSPSEGLPASLIVYGDGTNYTAILQTQNGDGYFAMDVNAQITQQTLSGGTGAAYTLLQPNDAPGLVVKASGGVFTHNVFEAWGLSAVAPSVFVNGTGALNLADHFIGNADVAGTVTISNPATSVAVAYTANYTGVNAPNVTATAVGADPTALGGVWITHQGGTGAWTGFTINVTTTPSSSAQFSYNVIG